MTAIYCTGQLARFLGTVEAFVPSATPTYGDWLAHTFLVDRKRCVIFMNTLTCYSVIMTSVVKRDVSDIAAAFKKRLITQLDHDFSITEAQEVRIRADMDEVQVSTTSNDKKIIGTINSVVDGIQFEWSRFGPVEQWDDLWLSALYNDSPIQTKVWTNIADAGTKFFMPGQAMGELIR